jgi:hypothetical protein
MTVSPGCEIIIILLVEWWFLRHFELGVVRSQVAFN